MSSPSDVAPGKKPSKGKMLPPNWPAMEPLYCAGILSISSIAAKYGVSRAAIHKHADRHGWVRSSNHDIQARANEMLLAIAPVTHEPPPAEVTGATLVTLSEESLQDNAVALAIVLMGQRKSITKAKGLMDRLMAELEDVMDRPELSHMVYDALNGDGSGCSELARYITQLPERARALKVITDTLTTVIYLERESYGLSQGKGAEDAMPTAIIRDYTGVGDHDSPGRDTDIEDDA